MSRGKLSDLLLEILKREHLASAPHLLEILQKNGHKYNKTSIYRALDRLLASEQICRTSLGKSEIFYEVRHDDHAHLVCNYCGKIFVHDMPIDEKLAGFDPEHSHITIFGRCDACTEDRKNPHE